MSKFKHGDKVRIKDRVVGYSQPDYSQIFTYGVGGDWDYTINKYEDDFELVEENKQRHIHYDMIVKWAANPSRVVEQLAEEMDEPEWEVDSYPTWNPWCKYRFKPEEPERVFPVTSLGVKELYALLTENEVISFSSLQAVANAAIKRYILEQEASK